MADNARPLGGLVRELEGRGMLRTVLGGEAAANLHVTAVDLDSRDAATGHLFVAVPGAETDGHDYAEAAVAKGAVAVVAERALPRLGVPQLLVGSSRSALALSA